MAIYFKRESILFACLIFLFLLITFAYYNNTNSNYVYLNTAIISHNWFKKNCLSGYDDLSLEYLPDYIAELRKSKNSHCNEIARRFNDIFDIEDVYGEIDIPNEFNEKIKKWLSNDLNAINMAKRQRILKLYNKFMHEEMIYNALRGKRPQTKDDVSEKSYSETLLKTSVNNCDFCDNSYQKNTAADTFGRIETVYTYTAANTFKYDKWHSLIVSRNHDTLNLNEVEFVDMFNVAILWFQKIQKLDMNAKYAQILWDAMPKSGASQVHTHLQCSMGLKSHYGAVERIKSASKLYYDTFYRDYLDDFILLHQALGLSLKLNNTYVIANLIPVKEHEIMIIDTGNEIGESFFKIFHHIIRAYVDVLEKYSFSMAMYLPDHTFDKQTVSTSKYFNYNNNDLLNKKLKYTICRVVFRTPVSNLRSDINGLDLYTSSVLGVDRFKVANNLFKILKRKLKIVNN